MCASGETGMCLQKQILMAASDACVVDYILHKQTQAAKYASYSI